MNTINIFIKNSGSTAKLEKDFALYVGSYQNKLIDVYVPTEILYSNQEGTFNNAIKIGAELTASNGASVTTNPYYLSYKNKVVIPDVDNPNVNVEYAVYERQLPKEFSVYAGNQTIVTNVISVDNTDPENPVILQVVTTQRCILKVDPSAYIGDEEVEDPSVIEALDARVTTCEENISDLQDDVADHETRIETLEGQVETNTNDISDLQQQIAHQDNYIGQIEVVTLDNIGSVLDQFVEDTTGEPAVNGDVVIVVLDINGQQSTYRYTYTAEGWQGFQISQINLAQNNVYGVIKGTYNTGSNNNIIVNASAGEITDLYYKNGGSYFGVASDLSSVKNTQANILSGSQAVGLATKAVQDQNGDVIDLTYAKAENVYTKAESDTKFLPKSYSDVYYYASTGIVDNIPITPASGIQFTANVGQVGEVEFVDASRTLQQSYNFNKNSTDKSAFWIYSTQNAVLSFRLLTYIQSGETNYLVSSELTGELLFEANTPKLVNIESIYSGLGNMSLETSAGDVFRKILYVTPANNVATQVNLYSNEQYPSSFNLASQSINYNINTINGIAQVNILQNEWTQNEDETYSVTIPQTRHQQAPTNQYILQLQEQVSAGQYQYIAFTPAVDSDGNITLTTLQAVDCELLIASGTSKDTRGILTLTDPTAFPAIDYSESGAVRILQYNEPTNLTLPDPLDVGVFYTFMVANDPLSTYDINVNGEDIQVGKGIQFKWVGSWITGEEPTNTTEVYDTAKSQTLNLTLSDMQSDITGLQSGKQDKLSQVQLDAVNSGADATKIGQIATNTSDISALQSGKQDALSQAQLNAVNSGVTDIVVAQVGTNTDNISTNTHNISVNTGAIENLNTVVATKNVKERAYSAKRSVNLSVPANTLTNVEFDTKLYSDEDWFDQSIGGVVLDVAHAITIKCALTFVGLAPSAGDIVLSIYDDATEVARQTVSVQNGHSLPQVVVGRYLTSATRNLTFKLEHTFSSAITVSAESGISAQVVDQTNKVSASDNAFDIEFGTRWTKDYSTNTITLK